MFKFQVHLIYTILFNILIFQFAAEDIAQPKKEQKMEVNREIETLLMIHEKKSSMPAIPGAPDADASDSSDSEAEVVKPAATSEGKRMTTLNCTCTELVTLLKCNASV